MTYAAHRIRLKPSEVQIASMRQCAGASRFWFNWALERWQTAYEAGEKVSDVKLRKELTQLKKTDEFAWAADLPQAVTANAIRDLGTAFKNFFRRVKSGEKPGYPRFKKKGVSRESFRPSDKKGEVRLDGNRLYIRGTGWVRLTEKPRFSGPVVSMTVSLDSDGHWYVSLLFETKVPEKARDGESPVGIDLGVATLATLSDGTTYTNEKHYVKEDRRLRRLQRKLSRQQKGSNRRARTKSAIRRLLAGQRRRRLAKLHETTTEIVLKYGRIAIEDLNVKGMTKLRSLARSVADRAFGEFRRQLTYKAEWYDAEIVIVDRWFPSSKTCSNCRHIKDDLKLSDRTYRCDACGVEIDRDLNAAVNLKNQIPGLDRELTLVESHLAGA